MIRPYKTFDYRALDGLIRRQHAASKYAGRVQISDKALDGLLMSMVAQQGQHGPQGSHISVAVRDGKVVGFIAGVLDRVYHIGNKLTANDLFFVNEGGSVGDTFGLIDSYVAWAKANRKVLEIMLSWSDTLPGAERVAELYVRKGFVKVGEMFEMRLDAPAKEVAA